MATIKDLLSKMIEKINETPKKLSDLEIDMETGVKSWNDLEDKPFDKIITHGNVVCKKHEIVVSTDENGDFEHIDTSSNLNNYPNPGRTLEVRINDIPYHVAVESDEGFPYFDINDVNCPITRWYDGVIDGFNNDIVYDGYTFTFEMVELDINIKCIDQEYIETIPIEKGGTGKTNATNARVALGIGIVNCRTSASTVEKVIDLPSYNNNGILFVYFSQANSVSAPKLKINDTTARTIYNFKTGKTLSANDIGRAMHLFVYSGGAWYLLNPMQ